MNSHRMTNTPLKHQTAFTQADPNLTDDGASKRIAGFSTATRSGEGK